MVDQVFDRRGRLNWSEDKRQFEDQRGGERRIKRDRRSGQRRQGSPWPKEMKQEDLRRQERRKHDRRATAQAASEIRSTFLKESETLMDAVNLLASLATGVVTVVDDDGRAVGMLSEHDVIKLIADRGSAAFAEPVSDLLKPQAG